MSFGQQIFTEYRVCPGWLSAKHLTFSRKRTWSLPSRTSWTARQIVPGQQGVGSQWSGHRAGELGGGRTAAFEQPSCCRLSPRPSPPHPRAGKTTGLPEFESQLCPLLAVGKAPESLCFPMSSTLRWPCSEHLRSCPVARVFGLAQINQTWVVCFFPSLCFLPVPYTMPGL